MFRDFIYAIRMFKKNPSFSLLTMFVMSVGLGLAIYMFAIVNVLAYKKLDLPEYDRLVVIDAVVDGFEQNGGSVFSHDYKYFSERQKSFEVFTSYVGFTANLSNGSQAQRYTGSMMEPEAFQLFDGPNNMIQGRPFTIEDEADGAEPVIIISHNLWQDYFLGAEDTLGSNVDLNGKSSKIIGIMNADFGYPMQQDVWRPYSVPTDEKAGQGWQVTVLARLNQGVSIAEGQQELASYASDIGKLYPETNSSVGVNTRTLVQMMMDNSMSIIYIMIGATVFILILVIANVGNLMLARSTERAKELAIRSALGAPKFRIIRQMMIETIIICAVGGIFGIILAGWGLDLTRPIFMKLGGWVAPWWTFSLGKEELIAALWIILGTGFCTGVIPALRSSDTDLNSVLRDGTRGALGKKEGRLSKVLVTVEILLSCAVLIVAGALIIAVNAATNADYGADPKGFLTARFSLSTPAYTEHNNRVSYHQKLITLLEKEPNVEVATIGSAFPGRNSGREAVKIEGLDQEQGRNSRSLFMSVDQSYFTALNVPVLEGRSFDGRDTKEGQQVVIVSTTFANKYWQNESAIGKRIKLNPNDEASKWLTIIGVVKHLIHQQPFGDAKTKPAIYVPNSQLAYYTQYVGIKVKGDPYDFQKTLINVAGQLDSNIPMYNILPYEERLYRRVLGINFVGDLFIIFGILALILASAGIYGVMSQNVTRRTQELGVRRALGATDSNIYKLLVKQSALMLFVGAILGGAIGFLGMNVISGNLIQLIEYAPIVIITVVFVIVTTTIIATLMPAMRIMKLEPNVALRYE